MVEPTQQSDASQDYNFLEYGSDIDRLLPEQYTLSSRNHLINNDQDLQSSTSYTLSSSTNSSTDTTLEINTQSQFIVGNTGSGVKSEQRVKVENEDLIDGAAIGGATKTEVKHGFAQNTIGDTDLKPQDLYIRDEYKEGTGIALQQLEISVKVDDIEIEIGNKQWYRETGTHGAKAVAKKSDIENAWNFGLRQPGFGPYSKNPLVSINPKYIPGISILYNPDNVRLHATLASPISTNSGLIGSKQSGGNWENYTIHFSEMADTSPYVLVGGDYSLYNDTLVLGGFASANFENQEWDALGRGAIDLGESEVLGEISAVGGIDSDEPLQLSTRAVATYNLSDGVTASTTLAYTYLPDFIEVDTDPLAEGGGTSTSTSNSGNSAGVSYNNDDETENDTNQTTPTIPQNYRYSNSLALTAGIGFYGKKLNDSAKLSCGIAGGLLFTDQLNNPRPTVNAFCELKTKNEFGF